MEALSIEQINNLQAKNAKLRATLEEIKKILTEQKSIEMKSFSQFDCLEAILVEVDKRLTKVFEKIDEVIK